jgi:hypothetical protein
MRANHIRAYFDEDPAKRASESGSESHDDEGLETGDDTAQNSSDDAQRNQSDESPPDPPDDALPNPPDDASHELASVICKLCQLIQVRQTAWETTYSSTEPIEPDHYHLELLVPECKSLNFDLCVYNGLAVIRSELQGGLFFGVGFLDVITKRDHNRHRMTYGGLATS